jgi:NAD dependent epimerase/dehydratase family enzyme
VDFSKELGKALHRPAFLPAPDLAIKTLLGAEFAEQVLFASQRVVPTKLMESGFEFEYPTLPEAFSAIL